MSTVFVHATAQSCPCAHHERVRWPPRCLPRSVVPEIEPPLVVSKSLMAAAAGSSPTHTLYHFSNFLLIQPYQPSLTRMPPVQPNSTFTSPQSPIAHPSKFSPKLTNLRCLTGDIPSRRAVRPSLEEEEGPLDEEETGGGSQAQGKSCCGRLATQVQLHAGGCKTVEEWLEESRKVAPPFLSLFILIYEAFHATFTREFPTAQFFIYVDDIAVIIPAKATLCRVLHHTHELSMLLGFRINHSKTEIYLWAPHQKCVSITWQGQKLTILAPVFKYLGHHLAHPTFLGRAHIELLSCVTADLARYQQLPLGAF